MTTLSQLTQIRAQLVNHQSSVNSTLKELDVLILNIINQNTNITNNIPDVISNISESAKGPLNDLTTKREKIKYVLEQASGALTAKEVRKKLAEYGENLANVDQTLVNLEKDNIISADRKSGKKKYFMERE